MHNPFKKVYTLVSYDVEIQLLRVDIEYVFKQKISFLQKSSNPYSK